MVDAGLEGGEGGGAVLTMWTIYRSDTPEVFVVRAFDIVAGLNEPVPRAEARLALSLEMARAMVPKGLYRLERSDGDDPSVVETWM